MYKTCLFLSHLSFLVNKKFQDTSLIYFASNTQLIFIIQTLFFSFFCLYIYGFFPLDMVGFPKLWKTYILHLKALKTVAHLCLFLLTSFSECQIVIFSAESLDINSVGRVHCVQSRPRTPHRKVQEYMYSLNIVYRVGSPMNT